MKESEILKRVSITLLILLFTFLLFTFVGSKANAENFCVGCPTATPANCSVDILNCPAGVNGGGVCPTIATAAAAAELDPTVTAETIKIAQGIYTGPGSSDSISPPFGGILTSKTINIRGGFNSTCSSRTVNASNTIINAPGGDRVFDIDSVTSTLNVTIDGVTIQNGAPAAGNAGDGGGIRARATGVGGSLIFISTDNTFDTNSAVNGGGASIEAVGGSIVATVTNNMIGFMGSPNTALVGGGIIFSADGGTLTVTNQNNIITSNTATAGPGGGIQAFADMSNLNVTISEDIISGNSANTTGGGVSIESDTGFTTTAILEKNIINNNIAALSGGGINFFSSGTINATHVSNNLIFKNQAQGASPNGGVVAAITGAGTYTLKFVNNTIADNQATGAMATGGGGISRFWC